VETTLTTKDLFTQMVAFAKAPNSSSFTVSEFTKFLRNFVGSNDIRLKTSRDANVDLDQIIISGMYDRDDDEDGLPSITVYVNYNPQQKIVRITDIDWYQLCIDLIECVGHEIIHQTQYRSRNFDVSPIVFGSKSDDAERRELQEYLGNPDEIEAYGYSIATEVYLKHFPKKLYSKHIAESQVFKTYLDAFGANHIVLNHLVGYSVKYFENLSSKLHAKI